jgi:hypothetical protein
MKIKIKCDHCNWEHTYDGEDPDESANSYTAKFDHQSYDHPNMKIIFTEARV